MFNFKKKIKDPKYVLLEPTLIVLSDGRRFNLHRIQALRDIPEHGVKAGDLGGYVEHERILSHEGSCWVGGNAVAMADPYTHILDGYYITNDAIITDNAFLQGVLSGSARVYDSAKVFSKLAYNCDVSGTSEIHHSDIDGSVILRGNVSLTDVKINSWAGIPPVMDGDITIKGNLDKYDCFLRVARDEVVELKGKLTFDEVAIRGNCKIDGEVNLSGVSFKDDNTILGKPQIMPKVQFTGKNIISGTSIIPPSSHVHDIVMDSGVLNYAAFDPSESSANVLPSGNGGYSPLPPASNEYIKVINQIEAEYEAYTTDIVKLIKYPAMIDASIPEVGEFVVKLRSAKRSMETASNERLAEIAESLEMSFVRAESKVQTLVASHLDEDKKKSLKTAEKMFRLACDDASPEPEKKLSFKAGMRSLEGVVSVSEKATENMKTRIGILELEA